MPSSPTKIGASQRQYDEWGTTLDADIDWEVYANIGNDFDEDPDPMDAQEIVVKPAAKCYPTSDEPLREWLGHSGRTGYREEYLFEDIRMDSRCGAASDPCSCNQSDENGRRERIYRCEGCFGCEMLCQTCSVAAHKRLPLHIIKDMHCISPLRGHVDFVVIHLNGIHHVNVDFCNCDQRISHRQQLLRSEWFPLTVHYPQTACTLRALEHFLILMWSSKVSVYEYYVTLERLTDNTGLWVPKSRYKAFMRMVRQFRHLKMLKRAGRGNIADGLSSMKSGDLAIACPACPHPDINLPEEWADAEPGMKFLYVLILAMDANFRLKNGMRLTEAADPGLHTGLAYFLPGVLYNAHILKHASQKDISTCSGFKTLAHAESKFSTGLRATGVGLCLCACHEFIQANGVGDLQKGERYCNMDYIFFSALAPLLLLSMVVSYDIACQWKVKLWEWMNELPDELQVPLWLAASVFMFGIPKFHCLAHQSRCAIPHSLNLMPGVGRTDSKGIERNWSEMNRVANSTKEIGPGSRHDTLDDHFGHHNWRKYTALGMTLRTRLLAALVERDRQRGTLKEFDAAMDPKFREGWTTMIQAWEQDKSMENPYITAKHRGETAAINGTVHAHETTPSAFLALALTLEESQRRMRSEVKNRFRPVQNMYMTGMDQWMERNDMTAESEAEDIKLWLPLDLDVRTRVEMCSTRLINIEGDLREAQCYNALDKLQNRLRTKFHYIHHCNINIRGQRSNTRAHALIDRMDDHIAAATTKYNRAREALVALKGHGSWENELRPLSRNDISPPNGDYITIERLDDEIGANGRKKSRRQLEEMRRGLGQGRKAVLWIWTTVGVLGDGEDLIIITALPRALRWSEEVMLLKEEMRRVRVYLNWKAKWWESRAAAAADDHTVAEGIAAYASRQAAIQCDLSARFTYLWENFDTRVESAGAQADPDPDDLSLQAALEEANEDEGAADDEDDDL
ncbi:hypothetical protein BV22DRAFT_1108535 [Leucogyrophana mollusca]|uniref:Uncharacterized protein n=1 Tax=Leucogyrophana mollusca TaxID=85980 RepID=A0ACB8AW82_9AGAM|nr:hypothetical protein BV22DRAFT_1108535 [Leucogyrophana mollusca]